jgi:hypothetical protein
MNGEVIETSADGTMRLTLHIDHDPVNPREEYDHLESVVTVPDGRYAAVDKDGGPLANAWRRCLDRHRHRDAVEVFTRYARIFHGATTLVSDPYHGPMSVWYLTREVADGPNGTPDPAAYLKAQADEYQTYAEGDTYGYVIEREVTWTRDGGDDTMTTWETIDSCWGFYGREYAEESAREAWQAATAQ